MLYMKSPPAAIFNGACLSYDHSFEPPNNFYVTLKCGVTIHSIRHRIHLLVCWEPLSANFFFLFCTRGECLSHTGNVEEKNETWKSLSQSSSLKIVKKVMIMMHDEKPSQA